MSDTVTHLDTLQKNTVRIIIHLSSVNHFLVMFTDTRCTGAYPSGHCVTGKNTPWTGQRYITGRMRHLLRGIVVRVFHLMCLSLDCGRKTGVPDPLTTFKAH